MTEARPFASLSSGLLARKGGAKPAMRPQGFGQLGASLEDLGWNDMGHSHPTDAPDAPAYEEPAQHHVPSSIAALTPSPRPIAVAEPQPEAEAPPPPPVFEQRRAIAESFGGREEEVAAAPAPRVPVASAPSVSVDKSAARRDKAAFTLRLDADRHFRLRLACAVTGRSAQQIVTGALDQILTTIPELEAMAGQVTAKSGKKS
jgi:hypothetical protein